MDLETFLKKAPLTHPLDAPSRTTGDTPPMITALPASKEEHMTDVVEVMEAAISSGRSEGQHSKLIAVAALAALDEAGYVVEKKEVIDAQWRELQKVKAERDSLKGFAIDTSVF